MCIFAEKFAASHSNIFDQRSMFGRVPIHVRYTWQPHSHLVARHSVFVDPLNENHFLCVSLRLKLWILYYYYKFGVVLFPLTINYAILYYVCVPKPPPVTYTYSGMLYILYIFFFRLYNPSRIFTAQITSSYFSLSYVIRYIILV